MTSPPERTCPTCGATTATYRPTCAACGARYDKRPPRLSSRARRILIGVGLAVLVAGTAVSALAITNRREHREDERAAALKRAKAEEIARLVHEQRVMRGAARDIRRPGVNAGDAAKLAYRRALVRALEQAILRDAKARVASGELKGNVRRAECGPLERSKLATRDEEDLGKPRGRYDCIATITDVVRQGKRVGQFGHPFVGTIDFRTATFVWCKDNKIPGERGVPLAKVRLAPECIGAEGRRVVGNGYAQADE